jgi:hypothetical protein
MKHYEKTTKIFWIIESILSVVFILGGIAIGIFGKSDWMSKEILDIIRISIMISYFLIMGSLFIFLVISALLVIKRGTHNIRECDDELFKKIDQYRKCWGESKYHYIKQIQIINLYYKENGKVDELVKKREVDRLYKRADFLSIQNSLFDYMVNSLNSLIISIVASYVFQIVEDKNGILTFLGMIVILVIIFALIMLRYVEKGQAGSYRYYIDEYEKDLLLKKINKLENELKISDADERILETKQVAINELIRIREKKRGKNEKKKIEADIRQVNELDLCLSDYRNYCVREIYINETKCCIVYKKEQGKENNYIGERNLANEQYALLYNILKKNDIIRSTQEKVDNDKYSEEVGEKVYQRGKEIGKEIGQQQANIAAIKNMLEFNIPKESILKKYTESEYNTAIAELQSEAK